jgi:hypothetical protein
MNTKTIFAIVAIVTAIGAITTATIGLSGAAYAAKGGVPGPNFNQGQCIKDGGTVQGCQGMFGHGHAPPPVVGGV